MASFKYMDSLYHNYLKENVDLSQYDSCYVEVRDGEPNFFYDTLEDAKWGVSQSKLGDVQYGDGIIHKYEIMKVENGRLKPLTESLYHNYLGENYPLDNSISFPFNNRNLINEKRYPYVIALIELDNYDPEGLYLENDDLHILRLWAGENRRSLENKLRLHADYINKNWQKTKNTGWGEKVESLGKDFCVVYSFDEKKRFRYQIMETAELKKLVVNESLGANSYLVQKMFDEAVSKGLKKEAVKVLADRGVSVDNKGHIVEDSTHIPWTGIYSDLKKLVFGNVNESMSTAATFNTKFSKDKHRNGQKVSIIGTNDNKHDTRYTIKFEDGTVLKNVFPEEIRIDESLTVDDMYGAAYQNGLESVIDILNTELGLSLSYKDDWEAVQNICDTFGIKFDENGNILRES